jgi:hypothetical protein
MPVKLTNAALEEKDDKEIVLRGSIDPQSLKDLKVGHYQREVLPVTTLNAMMDAVAAGRTPDVILGMRGEKFVSRNTNDFFLHNDVYIIDGLQRISAGIRMLELGRVPRIGALVYFNSNNKFEMEQFNALNTQAVKLSPNIIIRNFKDGNEAINMLYNLCADRTFPLTQRVTWSQRAGRGELISAATLVRAVGRLHAFLATVGVKHSRMTDLAENLEKVSKEIGRSTMRHNTMVFFETIDAAWGIRRVTYKDGAVQLRHAFLRMLADTFARHYDFWQGKNNEKLFITRDMLRKLASFPIHDPTIVSLASAGGKGQTHLAQLLVEHLDKGKRTGKLKSRMVVEDAEDELVLEDA